MGKEILLIDYNNLWISRAIEASIIDPLNSMNYRLFKSILIKSINKLLSTHQPNRAIVCLEGEHNWRKVYWTEYKSTRKNNRAHSLLNFSELFKVTDDLLESIQRSLPRIEMLKVPRAEADDLISVLTKVFTYKGNTVICASTDKDLYQLYKYKGFRQWDINSNKFKEYIYDHRDLITKIVTGDRGDNIPGLKRGVGPKTALNLITSGKLESWLKEEGLESSFRLNQLLIDLDCIPADIKSSIERAISDLDADLDNKRNKASRASNLVSENSLWSILDRVSDIDLNVNRLLQ